MFSSICMQLISHYLFLVTYIILIPFQSQIQRYKWSIKRMSAYIRVFFEYDGENIHWESFNESEQNKRYYKQFNNNYISRIRNTGTIQLGVFSTLCFNGYVLYYSYANGILCLK